MLAPQTTYYNQLGQDCAGIGCRVDLFVANNAYIDLATIGQCARLTGGQVYKYTYFQVNLVLSSCLFCNVFDRISDVGGPGRRAAD